MKKKLLLAICVLCSSWLCAQVSPYPDKQLGHTSSRVNADYSGSLFTKGDVLFKLVDFSADNQNYSTGVISEGSEGHTQTGDYSTWHRWPNTDSATLALASATYPVITQQLSGMSGFISYMGVLLNNYLTSADNGWMMMSLVDQLSPNTGNFNAFIQIDSIDATDKECVKMSLNQYYIPSYSNCYLDYSIDNWDTYQTMQINLMDPSMSSGFTGRYVYRLPLTVCGHVFSLRLRCQSLDVSAHSSYGNFWVVDDVSFFSSQINEIVVSNQEYVEGNYGMIPQQMTINPAWYGLVRNVGVADLNEAVVELYHLNSNRSASFLVQSNRLDSIEAGQQSEIYVDRSGWLSPANLNYRGWYGFIDHTAHGTGVPLPTTVAGDNYMYAQFTNQDFTAHFDTMYYQVTTADNNNEYLWAHDNGVLTYFPNNYYMLGFRNAGGTWYVTEDPAEVNFSQAGYMVTSRYTTDEIVPEGWVIHGVELVASPIEGYHNVGAVISAALFRDVYEDSVLSYNAIPTGAHLKTITEADVNDSSVIGRHSNGYLENGDYNTIYIPFPEQPALTPNTSYRVGYVLEEDGYFALAQEAQGRYRLASSTCEDYDTIIYFGDNDATAKWAHSFVANQYQNSIYDPSYSGSGSGSTFASYFLEYNPMIRLHVGPARAVARHNVEVSCINGDWGSVTYGDAGVCETTCTPADGSSFTLGIATRRGYFVGQLLIDDVAVHPWNETTGEGDPNYRLTYDDSTRIYHGTYTFPHISGNHTVLADFENYLSIEPIVSSVRVMLEPNPATSWVTLNIEGCEGTVNCTLIDMSGRIVYNQNFNASASHSIHVSNLAKGAYFVRITNHEISKVEKLIIR